MEKESNKTSKTLKKSLADVNEVEFNQKFLLDIDPKERARLEKLGLGPSKTALVVDRSKMDKTLAQIQHEKLEKLMERIDEPLEEEMRFIEEYRPVRSIGPRPFRQDSERSGNDYHRYKMIDKLKLKEELKSEKDELLLKEQREEQARRDAIRKREEEETAKKRAKRQKRKKGKSAGAAGDKQDGPDQDA
ncbi:hypothetical protein HDU91_005970 [Kappamyces sp. JEL0680]|nr:hypothetical protein HDU91_005970 [Kappamyces sp. JEL0680]